MKWITRILFGILIVTITGACQQQRHSNDPIVDRPPRKVAGIDPAGLPELLTYPDDDRDVEKRFAAVMIGITRELSGIEALNDKVIADRSPAVRAACAWAIGEIADPSGIEPLERTLRDASAAVRAAAVEALGRYDDPNALSILAKLSESGKGPLAMAALRSIAWKDTPTRHQLLSKIEPGDPHRFVAPGQPFSQAVGKIWYVDAASGNDNANGSEDAPFQSIGRAITELRAGAGDRIYASSGKAALPFRESVDIPADRSGTSGAPTVIAAWPGKSPPVLDGAKAESPDTPFLEDGIHISASFVRVNGFTVRHYKDSGIDIDGGTGCVVSNCVVQKCDRHGIFLYYAPASAIVNADVSQCNFQGISIRTSPKAAVLGGRSTGNGIDGLLFLWDSDDALVDNFTASGNQRGIGFIRGSHGGRIFRSKLTGNVADIGIEADCSAELIDTMVGNHP